MQRRYEVSDEQWNKIKHMFPKAKTGRPGLMFNAALDYLQWYTLERSSQTFWFLENCVFTFLQMA